jgi:hypothetical protein
MTTATQTWRRSAVIEPDQSMATMARGDTAVIAR